MKVEFKFELGSEIRIKAINTLGLIEAVMISLNTQHEYRVVYWDNSVRVVQWLYDTEIE